MENLDPSKSEPLQPDEQIEQPDEPMEESDDEQQKPLQLVEQKIGDLIAESEVPGVGFVQIFYESQKCRSTFSSAMSKVELCA